MKKQWYTKIWPWFKKYWPLVINPVVLLVAYSAMFDKGLSGAEVLAGLTLFANVAYWGYVWFIGGWSKLDPPKE